MYKFSFKIKHKGCAETALSVRFPKQHITVIDIQSKNPKQKQYFYYITGKENEFNKIIEHLKCSKVFIRAREIERSKDTLLLLVVIDQGRNYVQDVIQSYNGFFIDLHTVYGGYEYWHVGLLDRDTIPKMRSELKKAGEVIVLYIGEITFAHSLLSEQQKKVFMYANEQGYYDLPRKTTIAKLADALKLSPATTGEHLLKAENKILVNMAKKL
ncbi:MAG: helix-turn-helix domain-containing protein [Candidatus Woesearchaeota archaeon]